MNSLPFLTRLIAATILAKQNKMLIAEVALLRTIDRCRGNFDVHEYLRSMRRRPARAMHYASAAERLRKKH